MNATAETASPSAPETPEMLRLRAAVFTGFVVSGVVTTMIGPALPFLSARWSLNNAQAGLFFTLLFLGSSVGMIAFGYLDHRRGHGIPLLTGYTLMAIGVALLSSGALSIARFGVFTAGLGVGFVNPASNLLVASAPPAQRASRLSTLNFIWCIGAVICPFLVTFAVRLGSFRIFLYFTSFAVAVIATIFAFLHLARISEGMDTPGTAQKMESLAERLRSGAFLSWLYLAVLFFVYVGAESIFGGWAAALGMEMGPAHKVLAGLMPSMFWGMLLLGRGLGPMILRRVAEMHVLVAGILLICLSAILLLSFSRMEALAAAMAIAGLGCSTIYPILVAWMVAHIPGLRAAKLHSITFASGNAGGATLPWVVGIVSTHFGGLRPGFVLVDGATLAMLTLVALLHRQPRPSRQVAP